MDALGLKPGEYVGSEISGLPCVDIHHIISRGMGGTKTPDRIEILMALTREEHAKFGDKEQYMIFLLSKHSDFLNAYGVKYDRKFMADLIFNFDNTK